MNLKLFFFLFNRLVHQELLQSLCKADSENAVHLKNKVKNLYKNFEKCEAHSSKLTVLCSCRKDRPVKYFIWNRLSYSTKLTVV